jgi:hypothetical protein
LGLLAYPADGMDGSFGDCGGAKWLLLKLSLGIVHTCIFLLISTSGFWLPSCSGIGAFSMRPQRRYLSFSVHKVT